MAVKIADFAAFARLPYDEIIDVRSPAEFAEDHIPGAINLPVLSNEERALIGTIYVQQDPFLARKRGAALVARNAAHHLENTLANRPGGWRPLIYCWRGGQRSNSFTSILQQIGWRADVIDGGYRSYRRLVVQMLHENTLPHRLMLIDGGTGTAKTRLLHHIAKAGGQIVDLEGLAHHRGSLFGLVGGAQPSQKSFESTLAQALNKVDPSRTTWIEAESSKVGRLSIPPRLWKPMLAAPYVEISAPTTARAAHLVSTYPDIVADPARLDETLEKLLRYHGRKVLEHWRALAIDADWTALAADLITRHYDPRYKRIRGDTAPEQQFDLPNLADDTLSALAADLIARFP